MSEGTEVRLEDGGARGRWMPVLDLWALFVTFAALFVVAAWVRYAHITEIGFALGDSMIYWNSAKAWLDGMPTVGSRFYPGFELPWTAGMWLLGETDYALKCVNAAADLVTVLFVFVLARKLTGSSWVGLAAMALYAFTPLMVQNARIGHPHAAARMLGLATLWLFLKYGEAHSEGVWKRSLWLVLAGLAGGWAFTTHPTMAFVGPGYVLLILLLSAQSEGASRGRKAFSFFRDSAIFTAAFAAVFAFFVGLYVWFRGEGVVSEIFERVTEKAGGGFWTSVRVLPMLEAREKAQGWVPTRFESVFETIIVGIRRITERASFEKAPLPHDCYAILFFSALAILLVLCYAKRRAPLGGYALPLLVFVYALLLAYQQRLFWLRNVRYFAHVFPFVLLTIVFWFHQGLRSLTGPRTASAGVVLMAGVLLSTHPLLLPGDELLERRLHFSRDLYDRIGGEVNAEQKLLLLPYRSLESDEAFLRFPLRFGEQVVALRRLPFTGEGLLEASQRLKVGFVFVSARARDAFWDPRGTPPDFSKPDFYGFYHGEFASKGEAFRPAREDRLIKEFLMDAEAEKVYDSRAGKAYRIGPGSRGAAMEELDATGFPSESP